jgi:hypothetical protein
MTIKDQIKVKNPEVLRAIEFELALMQRKGNK